jgi:hypothetical protein
MHIVSLGVKPNPTAQEQEGIRNFYESLQVVIPCPICKDHYAEALRTMPIRTSSRDEIVEWVYDIHNHINTQLGKKTLSWEGFIQHMKSLPVMSSLSPPESQVPLVLLTLGIGVGIGLGVGYLRFR